MAWIRPGTSPPSLPKAPNPAGSGRWWQTVPVFQRRIFSPRSFSCIPGLPARCWDRTEISSPPPGWTTCSVSLPVCGAFWPRSRERASRCCASSTMRRLAAAPGREQTPPSSPTCSPGSPAAWSGTVRPLTRPWGTAFWSPPTTPTPFTPPIPSTPTPGAAGPGRRHRYQVQRRPALHHRRPLHRAVPAGV